MGFEKHAAALFLKMRLDGIKLGRVLTLGQQRVHLTPAECRRLLQRMRRHGMSPMGNGVNELLVALGADEVVAMDFSDYEGARLIHDLNQPVPPKWHEQYDVVFDGGTLEHVFDFPAAIKNCMQMLNCAGRFVSVTMLNNCCGHGFYQFSPELFYRVFSPPNGFSVLEMYVAETKGRAYAVKDPAIVKSRVELCNSTPVYLVVHARRDSISNIFREPPMQSDYVATWSGAQVGASDYRSAKTALIEQLRKIRWYLLGRHNFRRSLENRRFYTPVDLSF